MRMQYTKSEVLDFIEENDVKFIKLAFCDIFGCQKVIAIQPALVPEALETGIPIDASRITGFEREHDSELFLVPDTSTMSLPAVAPRARARRALLLRHPPRGRQRLRHRLPRNFEKSS